MKVVSALRRRCKDCKIIRRKKKIYVKCDTYPRHKQRQGFCTYIPMNVFKTPENIVPNIKISGEELLVWQNFCSTLIR